MANQFLSQISLGTQAVLIYTGNGSPEGVETAPVGSVYLNATASNAANAFYVKGSGTGNAGWSLLAASTIPAGSDTEIQFNDAGVSAGDPQLTWNKTTNTITIGGKTQIVPDVHTSGSPVGILYTGAAHTTLTASVESSDLYLNLTRTVQFAAGALTTQRAIRIDAPIYSFVSSSTITDASTVAISGPPVAGTNATITNSYALSIESGNMALRNEGGLHLFEAIGNGSNKLIFKAASSLSANSTYAWPIAPVSYPDGYGHYVLTGNGGNLAWTAFNSVTLAPHHYNTVPSGAVDGSNDVFVLAHIPALGTERVYKNGLRQKPGSGNDYTITSDTITFESGNIPKIGDVILADYIEGESIL